MAYVYILYSEILTKYYVGSTEGNINDRLKRHLSDHRGFTGTAKDWKVVYKEELPDKKAALSREKLIKSWKSRVKIEDLIRKST
jgi:putative endonuclease